MIEDVEKLRALRRILQEKFSYSELLDLSFDSGVDHEKLPITSKSDLARELLLFHLRHSTLGELIIAGKSLRADVNWENVTSASQEPNTNNNHVVYDSRYESPAFQSWGRYGTHHDITTNIKTSHVHPNGFPTLDMKCSSDKNIGVNKAIYALSGIVHFEYQAISSNSITKNIVFYMIPMQDPGILRDALIEVGANIKLDPKNGFSQYRKKLFIPENHVGDRKWHASSILFDFRELDTAFYSIFGPRINEGCSDRGDGQILLSNVQVTI